MILTPWTARQYYALAYNIGLPGFANPTPGHQMIYNKTFQEEFVPTATKFVAEEIVEKVGKEIIFSGLYYIARKKPLSMAGRIIAHGLPIVGWGMVVYDIYQVFDYLTDD